MVADFAVHSPDKEDGGISNPHFHVMCPIRPLDEHGRWGNKQRREYVLDEHGERILDEAGNYVFNAAPTTDWGSPETLEHWRQAWADLCNQKFAEKGLDCRIDHRSYERQGIEQIPTYYNNRNKGAYSTKAKTANLQRYADAFRFLQECEAYWSRRSPFCKTVERKIGNTWYTIETVCDGTEPLTAKVKRLIFSDREVACS